MKEASPESPEEPGTRKHAIIIDLNLNYVGGREAAYYRVARNISVAKRKVRLAYFREDDPLEFRDIEEEVSEDPHEQYIFTTLSGKVIQELVRLDVRSARDLREEESRQPQASGQPSRSIDDYRAIFHIWPDFPVNACITQSIATVKVDAARHSFSAMGRNIVWAVMDTGIDAQHRHFDLHQNLSMNERFHHDFTVEPEELGHELEDKNGHGTHVAGIIAGELVASNTTPPITSSAQYRNENGDIETAKTNLSKISGMAPCCKLVSLKVLNDSAKGNSSAVIKAIRHVQRINAYGRHLLIHGVNMSLGYDFEPKWFACGQSPLCVEVNRLVKSGVVVVVAAGNTGYGQVKASEGIWAAGLGLTINDPGNAELAITVGSTHRDMPHRYGVSYFSSKGPTGDGRLKPDLVAPGEKIVSCAAGAFADKAGALYCEYSGTSMAAPHVSGAIAAFLSIRNEYIGEAEKVKDIFVKSATDLHREKYFQGAGLIDLMRAVQSV